MLCKKYCVHDIQNNYGYFSIQAAFFLSKIEESSERFTLIDKNYEKLSALAQSDKAGEACSCSCRTDQLAEVVAELRQTVRTAQPNQAAQDDITAKVTENALARLQLHLNDSLKQMRGEFSEQALKSSEELRNLVEEKAAEQSSMISNVGNLCQEKGEEFAMGLFEAVADKLVTLDSRSEKLDRRLTEVDRKLEHSVETVSQLLKKGDGGEGERKGGPSAVLKLQDKVEEMEKKLEAVKTVVIKISG